jgi:single-strand DNA-binding protein
VLGDTQVHFVGRLGGDPEVRFTPSGVAVASLSVAVQSRRRNSAGEWEDGVTTWHQVSAWRDLAEHVASSLHKGDLVVIVGSLTANDYEKDGQTVRSYRVTADEISPSLRFVDVLVKRPARPSDVANDPAAGRHAPADPVDDPWSVPAGDLAPV